MDDQHLSPTPPATAAPEQSPAIINDQKPKINLIFLFSIIIIIALIGAGGYYLGKASNNSILIQTPSQPQITTYQPSPTPTPARSLYQSIPCDVKDKEFCNFLDLVYPLVLSSDFSELLNYQDTTTITCDQTTNFPIPLVPVCNGAEEGEKRKGYTLAFNRSEFDMEIISKEMIIERLQEYFHRNQLVLEYKGSVVNQAKGVMVFLNSKRDSLFALELKKVSENWRIQSIVIGTASNDYLSLDDKILTYFR